MGNYRIWHSRIRDHITAGNHAWGRLLDIVERQRIPLTFNFLTTYPRIDGVDLDLVLLAKELWCFLGQRLGDAVYSTRIQLAGGEDRNGIELWRRLFMNNEGGAEQVALSGLRRLHRFHQCPNKEKVGHFLGEGSYLRTRYGANTPDNSQWTMLMNVLPEDVQNEVRDAVVRD